MPNPPKTARPAAADNQEMVDRLSQQKSIRRTIGRRKSQTEFVPNIKADLDLFNKIRLDKDGLEFDEYEAANAISKLTYLRGDRLRARWRRVPDHAEDPVRRHRAHGAIPTQRDITHLPAYGGVVDRPSARPGGTAVPHRTGGAICMIRSPAKIEGYAETFKPRMCRRTTSRRSWWNWCRPSTISIRRWTQTPSAG